jgi:hypothetical protein
MLQVGSTRIEEEEEEEEDEDDDDDDEVGHKCLHYEVKKYRQKC